MPSSCAGLKRLPEITVRSAQHGQEAEPSRGCLLFVERPPEQVAAAAAQVG